MKRLLQEGMTALKNLCAPKKDIPPENLWLDCGGSCLVERPAGWKESRVDISVIIPCYNNARYLNACLHSVLEQQGDFTFEAVVIDDGSTDETQEVLSAFRQDARVILHRQENQGHSGARNTGLEICHGAYILFHDSDDTLCPGALEALWRQAAKQGADIVAGGYLCVTPAGEQREGKTFPDGRAEDPYKIPGMTCGKLFRRELFASLQFPLGYWYEDSIICQILFPLAKNVYTVSAPIFTYLINPDGVSASSQGQPKALESLYVTRRLLAEREQFGLHPDEKSCAHFLEMVLLTYHRTRRVGAQAIYPVFLAQRQLYSRYFAGIPAPAGRKGLADSLEKGAFRRYVWLCETLWLRGE